MATRQKEFCLLGNLEQGKLCWLGPLLVKLEVNLKKSLWVLEHEGYEIIFAAEKKRSPCIIFIDKIGGSYNPKDQQYMKITLNQLLVGLDAATNFPGSLDKALVRPGCFNFHVVVPNLDVEGHRQILECHMSKVLKADDVDLMIIGRGTPGFSSVVLVNLVNVSALKAAMVGAKAVSMADHEYAKDKIMMVSERKSAVISDESRHLTTNIWSVKATYVST